MASQAAAKVSLVANGTDLVPPASAAEIAQLRADLGLSLEEVLVAAVGRLVDKKGFDVLVESLPRLVERRPQVRLVIGGGGPLAPALRERAVALGVERHLLLPGALSHPQVLALLGAADVVAMPSVRDDRGNIDGLPIVVLEAMAAGRPLVASAIAGIPLAVVDQVTGLLVPERDPEALASALGRLIDDPDLGRRLGAAARVRVAAELTWTHIARRHDQLWRELERKR